MNSSAPQTALALLISLVALKHTALSAHDSIRNKLTSDFESLDVEARAGWCNQEFLQPLYANIDRDVSLWMQTGISKQLMATSVMTHTLRSAAPTRKGFFAGFRNGTAVLPDSVDVSKDVSHHFAVFFQYMHVLLDLQHMFGNAIPDVDFVINTFDCPGLLTSNKSTPLPVMRFAKSPATPDILIPNFHSYSADHNNQLVDMTADINRKHPWSKKYAVLFARFSFYDRYILANDPYTQRHGAGGAKLCKASGYSWGASMQCKVRQHLADWSKTYPDLMDIDREPRISLMKHAGYKYLAHVDGQGLSSKLEQLLPLGSLIFKEESGYYAYYHHLLKPYEHYVPFWKEGAGPEDVLEALRWAGDHESEAHNIAVAGQQVAQTYLTRPARACYWLKLLTAYAKLLTYTPSSAHAPDPESGSLLLPGPTKRSKQVAAEELWSYNKTVEQFLNEEAGRVAGGRWMRKFKFRP